MERKNIYAKETLWDRIEDLRQDYNRRNGTDLSTSAFVSMILKLYAGGGNNASESAAN